MSQYSDKVRQWAIDTRRAGCLSDADGIGEVGLESEEVGKRLAARFTLKVELDRIADVRYEVFGCGFSMAACAVAADLAVGVSLERLKEIDATRLNEALDGLPADRGYCADLAVSALRAAATSVRNHRQSVMTSVHQETDHGARVGSDDPVYSLLMNSPVPDHIKQEDRHLFACLFAVAAQESEDIASGLGLSQNGLNSLLLFFFPEVSIDNVLEHAVSSKDSPPSCNDDILKFMLKHVPTNDGIDRVFVALWLARMIAVRASLPGHLWVAMGLTERPQLTAAIRRHLPLLADANDQNMRWKRFLYKQVCDLNGGVMCKAPNCGVCSDYHLCFVEKG